MVTFEFLAEPFLRFARTADRVHYLYIYSALVIATLVYFVTRNEQRTIKSWLQFCFPREIYLHKSAKLDYLYFLINSILFAALIAPAAFHVFNFVGTGLTNFFISIAGPSQPQQISILTLVAFTLLTTLATDFGVFYSHYLHHKIPFLWQFHKVHHTAEVLTPITVYRMHPLDDLITLILSSSCSAVIYALFNYHYPGQITTLEAFGVNIILFVFYLLGYNLRHSHIWLSYGRIASHIFISPAQHQIHHSYKPEHIDKNFGLIFAFWDWMFRCLYIPAKQEQLALGIDDDQENFGSVKNLYLQPFRWGWQNKRTLTVAVVVLLLTLSALSLKLLFGAQAQESKAPIVTLEDLTFSEVQYLLSEGYTTAIVPTGGTEQNGPHVVLGKHNYIVKLTSEAVARQVGKALVAPVIAYVPEGDIDPPTGHMHFAGTISVPSDVFSATLEFAARSLKQHGFKLICFMGDSGWNQTSQERVAEKLTTEWEQEKVKVVSLNNYYFNRQTDVLTSEGYTAEQIGQHAGIRDTSELLYVHPAGVRTELLSQSPTPPPGVSGDFWLASAPIGKGMIQIKIDAAVQQIRDTLSVQSAKPDALE